MKTVYKDDFGIVLLHFLIGLINFPNKTVCFQNCTNDCCECEFALETKFFFLNIVTFHWREDIYEWAFHVLKCNHNLKLLDNWYNVMKQSRLSRLISAEKEMSRAMESLFAGSIFHFERFILELRRILSAARSD